MNRSLLTWNNFFKDLSVAFFGVTAALFVNTLYEGCSKTKSYRSMVRSIITEANGNSTILEKSFRDNVHDTSIDSKDSIVIYRDFKLSAVEYCLQNDNFMAHCPDSSIEILTNYILSLRRMNSYRGAYQKYLEEKNHSVFQIYHVRKSIFNEIPPSESEIDRVKAIKF